MALMFDELAATWAKLKSLKEIRYHTSPYIPKTDEDGEEIVVKFPIEDGYVLLLHPDVLSSFRGQLERIGYELVPFDWKAYSKAELDRQLSAIRMRTEALDDVHYQFKFLIREMVWRRL